MEREDFENLFKKIKSIAGGGSQKEVAEKARVAAIVKKMNQDNKKKQKAHPSKEGNKTKRKPVRFPGT